MNKTTEKSFDCIDSKRRAQQRINRAAPGSLRQRADYIEKRASAGPLGDWWRQAKRARLRTVK